LLELVLKEAFAPSKGTTMRTRDLLTLTTLSFFFAGCDSLRAGKDAALSAAASRIPQAAIEKMDDAAWQGLKSTLTLIEDPEALADLAAVAAPLTRAADAAGAPAGRWNFHLIASAEPNAFALPGGTIGVHSGLFAISANGDEFAGILGHEVGHVVERHGVQGLVARAGAVVALSLLMGDVGGLTQIAMEQAVGLTLLKFSRDNERQADHTGVLLLRKAGYPTRGLPAFFKGLQAIENEKSGNALPTSVQRAMRILSTHPMSQERAANLDALAKGDQVAELPAAEKARYLRLRKRVLASVPAELREKHNALAKAFQGASKPDTGF